MSGGTLPWQSSGRSTTPPGKSFLAVCRRERFKSANKLQGPSDAVVDRCSSWLHIFAAGCARHGVRWTIALHA
jgi:hypothetical protein